MKKKSVKELLFPGISIKASRDIISTLLGVLVEIVAANLLIFLLFILIPEISNRFLEMNIHPLVLITAAIGIRHGYIAGLIAALTSSIVYIAAYLITGLNITLFFSSYIYYKFVIMFFVTGYATGRVRDTYTRNVRTMMTANSEILEEYAKLEQDHAKSIEMYNELRNQIIGSEYSIFSLYEIAASLQTTNPEKVYTESIGLLHKFIKATTIAIYTLESGGYMRLKIIYGDYTRKRSSIRFVDEPKYVQLVEKAKPVRWTREEDEDFPLFSAPIIDGETVIGIINIDDIEFEHFLRHCRMDKQSPLTGYRNR